MKFPALKSRSLIAAISGAMVVTATAIPAAVFASQAPSATTKPVLVTCAGRAAVKPSSYLLACGDGSDYLDHLRWVSWQNVAFGDGTQHTNDCKPNCASKQYSYPILITLWRPEPRPGHRGKLYFTRLTVIRTGGLHRPNGSTLPLTETYNVGF